MRPGDHYRVAFIVDPQGVAQEARTDNVYGLVLRVQRMVDEYKRRYGWPE